MPAATNKEPAVRAAHNTCNLCAPLGASLAFRGIADTVPLLHGSQGCSTYIRRYLIGHFREPVDIASSSFGESAAIFGGRDNFIKAVQSIVDQYDPRIIGVATTCLSETIGDDVSMYIREYLQDQTRDTPLIVAVSTPSYRGSYSDGFHDAVRAIIAALAGMRAAGEQVNVFPGMLSPEDMRQLKGILADFHLPAAIMPDYSDTLDGGPWEEYQTLPSGGASIKSIRSAGGARATIEFGRTLNHRTSAGSVLQDCFSVKLYRTGTPIGIRETDSLFSTLETISQRPTPDHYKMQRERLIDAYVDGHKYVFGKRAIVIGEADLVVGLASFLSEIGVLPVVCATGCSGNRFTETVQSIISDQNCDPIILENADFARIEELIPRIKPDMLIGYGKSYFLARKYDLPLVRVGFPIQDRFGAQRMLHIGYEGALRLFDTIVNTLIERNQRVSGPGYMTY
jgi:nitrogenase molybdenum-iron protein NifN